MRVGGVSGSPTTMLRGELEGLSISRRHFPGACRFKLYARICRSFFVWVINALTGKRSALIFADMVRKIRGKTALWSRQEDTDPILHALPERPLVSLLVATFGREEPLGRLFSSLNQQTYQNLEVLIADQNPPGFLDDAVRSLDEHIAVQHIVLQERGVSQARNALLPLAHGDIIAFPDDDCWYAPGTLERVARLFEREPQAGGLIVAWAEGPRPQAVSETVKNVTAISAFQRAGTLVQFYRRTLLQGLFFDPVLGPGTNLPYGCGEDTDYLLQVLGKGANVLKIPDVLVFHPEPDLQCEQLAAKVESYARGRMYLLRKHKFPFWFVLVNILYPLSRVPYEGLKAWQYRKSMFLGRLRGFFAVRKDF
jgi:glycosyltransferase involved in cell wall biosynthesis